MADLFGGIPVIPDWLTTNARFQSIAQGQATARNFMDAYNSAANRKQDQSQFEDTASRDRERIQIERDRQKRIAEEQEAARKRQEELLAQKKKEFEDAQAKQRAAEQAAGHVTENAQWQEFSTGQPATPDQMLQWQIEGWKKYDPEQFSKYLEGTRKLNEQAEALNRPPSTYNFKTESGSVDAVGIPTGPGSQRIIEVKPPTIKATPAAGTVDIFNARGDKIGTKKVSAEELKQIEAEAQKPASGKKLPPEGTTAVNPQTGKRMIVKDGKWQAL